MIEPLAKYSAGLDVHKAMIVCTILYEDKHGALHKETREYKHSKGGINYLPFENVANFGLCRG